jgi:hypothetical protein
VVRFARLIKGAAAVLMDLAVRPAFGGNLTPAPATTQGGAALVTAGSAPAGQQVEHHQPDHHQGKEDEQVPHDVHRGSLTAYRQGGYRLLGGRSGKRRWRPPQRGAQTPQPIPQAKVAGLHGQQQQA